MNGWMEDKQFATSVCDVMDGLWKVPYCTRTRIVQYPLGTGTTSASTNVPPTTVDGEARVGRGLWYCRTIVHYCITLLLSSLLVDSK